MRSSSPTVRAAHGDRVSMWSLRRRLHPRTGSEKEASSLQRPSANTATNAPAAPFVVVVRLSECCSVSVCTCVDANCGVTRFTLLPAPLPLLLLLLLLLLFFSFLLLYFLSPLFPLRLTAMLPSVRDKPLRDSIRRCCTSGGTKLRAALAPGNINAPFKPPRICPWKFSKGV